MLIVNTEQHTRTALMVEPFGTDGALHFTPIDGDKPGRSFILDAASVRYLHTATAPATEPEEDTPDFIPGESPDPDWMNP